MFEEDKSPAPPQAPGFNKAAGIVLWIVVIAALAGGAFWVRRQNQALTRQVTALEQQSSMQAANLRVLQDRLHLSTAALDRLREAASSVQQKVSLTQAQLASTQRQAQTLAQQQQQAASELANVKQQTGQQLGAINGQITGVQGHVATNQKAIASTQAELEATKAELKSTIGDLGVQSGLIATTRDQLSALEKRGERAYFEFKLTKTKQPVRVGAVGLQVKKIDVKHARYTLDVYADDARVEKKDKTLNEPVQFYVGSGHALNELVVYQMDKKTLVGYLSAPKFPQAAAQH